MTGGVRVLDSTGQTVSSSGGHLNVRGPITPSLAGYTGLLGFNDTTGTIRIPIAGSSQGLLGMAKVSIDFEECFAASAISTTKWKNLLTTMTSPLSNNKVILNGGNSVASGAVAALQSWRTFEFSRGADRVIGWQARITASVTGVVIEIGAPVATGVAVPTGGAFFRLDAAGVLKGVAVSVTGSEVETAAMAVPSFDEDHEWVIVVAKNFIYFQIDDVIVGSLPLGTTAASPIVAEWAYAGVRIYNSAAVAQPVQLHVARCLSATFGGSYQYSGEMLAALAGDVGTQGIVGASSGSLAQWPNSAASASATLSNTTAGYTAFPGNFQFAAVVGAETDYALFAIQIPAPTAGNKGSTFLLHGVTIDCWVQGAATGSETIMQWGIGYGSSAVSLATTDSVTTKAPRRVPVGVMRIPNASPVGYATTQIQRNFRQPLPVNAGEYLHIILRIPQGAATASVIFRGVVGYDATWI